MEQKELLAQAVVRASTSADSKNPAVIHPELSEEALAIYRGVLLYAIDQLEYNVSESGESSEVGGPDSGTADAGIVRSQRAYGLSLDNFLEHLYVERPASEKKLIAQLTTAPFRTILIKGRAGMGKTSFTLSCLHRLFHSQGTCYLRITAAPPPAFFNSWTNLTKDQQLEKIHQHIHKTIRSELRRHIDREQISVYDLFVNLFGSFDVLSSSSTMLPQTEATYHLLKTRYSEQARRHQKPTSFREWLDGERSNPESKLVQFLDQMVEELPIPETLLALSLRNKNRHKTRPVLFFDNVENVLTIDILRLFTTAIKQTKDYVGDTAQIVLAMRSTTVATAVENSNKSDLDGAAPIGIDLDADTGIETSLVLRDETVHSSRPGAARSTHSDLYFTLSELAEDIAELTNNDHPSDFDQEVLSKRLTYLTSLPSTYQDQVQVLVNFTTYLLSSPFLRKSLSALCNRHKREVLVTITNFVSYLRNGNHPLYANTFQSSAPHYRHTSESQDEILSAFLSYLAITTAPRGNPVIDITPINFEARLKGIAIVEGRWVPIGDAVAALESLFVLSYVTWHSRSGGYDENQVFLPLRSIQNELLGIVRHDRVHAWVRWMALNPNASANYLEPERLYLPGEAPTDKDKFAVLPRGRCVLETVYRRYHFLHGVSQSGRENPKRTARACSDPKSIADVLTLIWKLGYVELSVIHGIADDSGISIARARDLYSRVSGRTHGESASQLHAISALSSVATYLNTLHMTSLLSTDISDACHAIEAEIKDELQECAFNKKKPRSADVVAGLERLKRMSG